MVSFTKTEKDLSFNGDLLMNLYKENERFNQSAGYYDKYRPGYPEEIIDSLISVMEISYGSELLEIGCGSGKATGQFVGNVFDISGIDFGENLVRIGNERFKNENIEFLKGRFALSLINRLRFDKCFVTSACVSASSVFQLRSQEVSN